MSSTDVQPTATGAGVNVGPTAAPTSQPTTTTTTTTTTQTTTYSNHRPSDTFLAAGLAVGALLFLLAAFYTRASKVTGPGFSLDLLNVLPTETAQAVHQELSHFIDTRTLTSGQQDQLKQRAWLLAPTINATSSVDPKTVATLATEAAAKSLNIII